MFKKRLFMPLAVMVLGILGAFTTTSMSSDEVLSQVTGYRFLSTEEPCHAEIMCQTEFSPDACTSGGNLLWDKVSEKVCNIPLYKIPE